MANWPDRALTSYGLAGRITGAAVSSVCSPRACAACMAACVRATPGQRHWPCTDRGDRSGAGLQSRKVGLRLEAIAK